MKGSDTTREKNVFFDINKLPAEKGLLLFGLSMNRLGYGGQDAESVIDHVRIFHTAKVAKPLVGLNLIYSDFLYLYNSEKTAQEMKGTFMHQVIEHKNAFQRLIEKNSLDFQIQHAFNYLVWNQLYVGTKDFGALLDQVKKIAKEDPLFQKCLQEDALLFERDLHENQADFFLEESLMFYLLTKNKVRLPNDYIENNQKWILFCYPGRPLKTTVYLYQLNPFKLDWSENPYQDAFYDLEAKQLVKYADVDLETYSVKK